MQHKRIKETQSVILQPNNLGEIAICKLTILKHTSLSYYLSYYFEIKCTQKTQHNIMCCISYAFSPKLWIPLTMNPAKFFTHTCVHSHIYSFDTWWLFLGYTVWQQMIWSLSLGLISIHSIIFMKIMLTTYKHKKSIMRVDYYSAVLWAKILNKKVCHRI